MLQNILGFISNSPIETAMRVGLFMIAATFLTLLAIRLTMSAVSVVRVKARKQWMVEPASRDDQSPGAQLMFGKQAPPTQENLLSDDVRRLLEKTHGIRK